MSRRLPLVLLSLALLAAGAAWALVRVVQRDARGVASRLLGCPAGDIDLSMAEFGDTERWRIEGCGVRGLLVCEPTDPGCYILPDER